MESNAGPSAAVRILVLCTGNSCRSQMAEAFLSRAGGPALIVASAGTHPTAVHPLTIQVLAERGIDWSEARSTSMTEFLARAFDIVITVCDEAAEACPVFPGGGRRVHAGFEDPAAVVGPDPVRLAAFRRIRDEIEGWAMAFARTEIGTD
ncbi:MAG: arsenate reductase ArsC [Chloroflexota bacterium]